MATEIQRSSQDADDLADYLAHVVDHALTVEGIDTPPFDPAWRTLRRQLRRHIAKRLADSHSPVSYTAREEALRSVEEFARDTRGDFTEQAPKWPVEIAGQT